MGTLYKYLIKPLVELILFIITSGLTIFIMISPLIGIAWLMINKSFWYVLLIIPVLLFYGRI